MAFRMITEQITIDVRGTDERISRLDEKPRPAVIVLEGSTVRRRDPADHDQVGRPIRRFGDRLSPRAASSARLQHEDVCDDVAAARDWLNGQP